MKFADGIDDIVINACINPSAQVLMQDAIEFAAPLDVIKKGHVTFDGIAMEVHGFFYFIRRRDIQVEGKLQIK